MATLSKDEVANAEASLLAEEQALKEKWCKLKGHRWDLPAVSPFSNGHLTTCETICNRCNTHAMVTIALQPKP